MEYGLELGIPELLDTRELDSETTELLELEEIGVMLELEPELLTLEA